MLKPQAALKHLERLFMSPPSEDRRLLAEMEEARFCEWLLRVWLTCEGKQVLQPVFVSGGVECCGISPAASGSAEEVSPILRSEQLALRLLSGSFFLWFLLCSLWHFWQLVFRNFRKLDIVLSDGLQLSQNGIFILLS